MKLDNVEDIYELSPLQEGMLFHTLLTPGTGMYVMQAAFPLYGALDVQSFERAWQTVVDRHTILRTSFHWNNVDKPLQVVYRSVKLPVQYLDWTAMPSAERQARLDTFLTEDRERGFELSEAPLLRLSVTDQGEGSRHIVFSLHHLLIDGWSSDLVYTEAAALYDAYCRNVPLELPPCRPYGDYIAWLQRQDLSIAEAYWRKALKGYLGPLPLGVGLPPGPRHQASDFDMREACVARRATDALREVARQNQLTLNTMVQGAWALLLSRYCGEDDVVFGATVSGRPAEIEGIESIVGLFINTLPVRVRVSPDAALIPWLRELQKDQFEARRFEHTPLVRIHSWSDTARDAPLFETLVGFENFPAGTSGHIARNASFEFRIFGQTNYPLALDVSPGSEWVLKLMYARSRFEPEVIDRLLGHFSQLLAAIADNPMRRLSEIPLLTSEECGRLARWNGTATSYPREATIHQLFEEQVRQAPDAIAVSFEGESLTYGALNRRANQLGRRLRERDVRPDTLVAICVESPIELAAGVLGILKAGGAYVPLDPAYPPERLLFMLEDSGAAVLVTTHTLAGKLPVNEMTMVALDDLQESDDDEHADLPNRTRTDNLAYVMYTSGSTGQPKGAAVPHRAVIRTVRDTNYITLGPSDAIAQISNFCFDAATFEVWGALLNGARLAGISRTITLSPGGFATALRSERVTTAFVTTDLFNQLVRERPDIFRAAGAVLVGGSAVDAKWVAACLRDGPPRRLLHVYGPTESTTFASWHLIERVLEGARTIPIGSPLANTQLYVLDSGLMPVPEGIVGEIYIGGDGLARGYLNRPELTAERFVPDPFSGRPGARLYKTGDRACRGGGGAIEFLGRLDDQVKIRGFRVELGEIESVLRAHQAVSEAVVLAREDVPGSRRLVAYIVPANGNLAVADLRRVLESKLPDYMVPSAFVLRDSLPLTPNGKVDRKALAAPEERLTTEEPYAEPGSTAEKTLARIWSDVLAVERVGIHDNFFELGGDSIISIQIVARAREAGLDLTLRQLFQNQTVAELAAVAGTEARARAEQGILDGEVPLMPVQHWFFEQQPVDAHRFNQAALMETSGGLDAALLEHAVERLLAHHDALRLRFRRQGATWKQFYHASAGPAPFRTVDLRTMTEPELRTRIQSEVEAAQGSLDLESGPIARFVWFDLGARPGRLLVVIHHLAVDSVSWRILMQDFWSAYEFVARGEEVVLPAKTSSLRQWAARLDQHAQSAKVSEDLPFWIGAASSASRQVPLDLPGGENIVATAATVTVELNEEDTRALVQETPKAYRTQINDVLLTALAQVLARWTGNDTVTFHLEGHGREPLFDDVDLTRTVGWFTTIFPVRLDVKSSDPGEALKAVKEQLRRIPNRGLTYGLLRYLASDSQAKASLTAHPNPDVSFNYLGQFSAAHELESGGQERSVRARRPHLLEVNAAIFGGRLRVHWEYSENHHRHATVERVAAEFLARLGDLIAHCRSPRHAGFTPSDFAHAGISQRDLDKLLATSAKSERPAG
jgi:amino acid adenylation domain-containing protein/non-ribosomal peptide synthase protein (TIGR01720 family)